jgi:phosphate acetyltransferase
MPQNLYITSGDARSGKAVIALGMMEMLSRHARRVGFFRPLVAAAGSDPAIELIAARYDLSLPEQALFGTTRDDARALLSQGRYGELLKRILARFKDLEEHCEHVLVMGTHFGETGSALQLDFNADVANNLGCSVLAVVNGCERSAQETGDAAAGLLESLRTRGCEVLATVVNRVPEERMAAVQARLCTPDCERGTVYVVPENPILGKPTVGDIACELDATPIMGERQDLNREIRDYKIAAMEVPHFLDYLDPDTFVIAPGDRSDIILGSLLSHLSGNYPQLAGILLTGGLQPATQVRQLIDGLSGFPIPVLGIKDDTFAAAMRVNAVEPRLRPDNERKIAAALGLVEGHLDLQALEQRLAVTRSERLTPLMFEYRLLRRAGRERRHIVLPEGNDERILRAAEILLLRGVVSITLLGPPDRVRQRAEALGLNLEQARFEDPLHSERRREFAETYYRLRRHKGVSEQMAYDAMSDVSYFGTMMVHHGYADGMVSGAAHTTQHTIRPAFETIKTAPGSSIVSSVFFMCLEDRVLVYGDCAVNPDPSAEQLADIAIDSAATARMFGIEPRIALLSYSTGDSGKGAEVDKVRRAVAIARERHPDLTLDGPIQYDAAVDPKVARAKLPGSRVAGNATVLVFPDLNTGNNTYKAVQRSAGAVAVGPVLQGLKKPVNDLSRGCTVTDIVNTVAITAIQAQGRSNESPA